MSKYGVEAGDPILMLAEEASEVIKECMKAQRFGLAGTKVWLANGGLSPRENIVQEVGDFLVIVDRLVANGVMGWDEIEGAKAKKRERLRKLFDGEQ